MFDKLVYLEPQEPIRTRFLYNNLMFSAAGYLIELQSGKTWEKFVRERILDPLEMTGTGYEIAWMLKQPEFGVPFTERRDSSEIYRIPYYEDIAGVAPCGAIASNIDDLSHWLIALMNEGRYKGKQVLPAAVLKETLQPSISLPNTNGELNNWWEMLNQAYGMGRFTASYRGHLLTFHGGDLPGFHSQISFMPQDHIGVIVQVIGDHSQPLYNIVSYNVYERLLGMDQTPWSARQLEMRLQNKKAGTESRTKANVGQITDARPSHPLSAYVGIYDHPAYGPINITLKDNQLQFDFHKMKFPMTHFHYDRFDTPDDEQDGKWSLNFRTNPQGDIDQAVMSLDEAEGVFLKRPEAIDPAVLSLLPGQYLLPNGIPVEVVSTPGKGLSLVLPGQPVYPLLQVKAMQFRIPTFSDVTFEFLLGNGKVTGLKRKGTSGEMVFPRKI